MKLQDVKVGAEVLYTPHQSFKDSDKEVGVVTSVNNRFAFVRYGHDTHSKATDPEYLEEC